MICLLDWVLGMVSVIFFWFVYYKEFVDNFILCFFGKLFVNVDDVVDVVISCLYCYLFFVVEFI